MIDINKHVEKQRARGHNGDGVKHRGGWVARTRERAKVMMMMEGEGLDTVGNDGLSARRVGKGACQPRRKEKGGEKLVRLHFSCANDDDDDG